MLKLENNDNKLGIYLLCMFIAVNFLEVGTRINFIREIRFEFLLGGILTAFSIVQIISKKYKPSKLLKYIVLLYLFVAIQVPLSIDVEYSSTVFIDHYVKFSMLALFITVFIRSPSAMKLLVGVFLVICFRLLYEATLGWITGNLVWQSQGIDRLHGSTPLLGHPNSLSTFALCTLPFAYFLFSLGGKIYKVFFLMLLSMVFLVVLNTGSRAGYLTLFGFVVILILKSDHKKLVILFTIAVMVLAVNFIPDQYIGRFESIYKVEERKTGSADARMQIMEDAWEIFKKHPFGVGVQTFPLARTIYFDRQQNIHNLYLEVLTNLGIQGFIVWLLFLAAIFSTIRENNETFTSLVKVDSTSTKSLKKHVNLSELLFLIKVNEAIKYYIIIRLFLGLFAMDFYQNQWWFALGIVLALNHIAVRLHGQFLKKCP